MAAHEANPGDFIPAKSIKFLQFFDSLIIKSDSVLLALKPEKLLIFSQYGTLDIVFEILSFTSLRPSNVVDLSSTRELLSAFGPIIILLCAVGAINTPFPTFEGH